jgi:hypothetical protein
MNAYELADELLSEVNCFDHQCAFDAASMLRQQADEIGSLKARLKQLAEEIGCYKIELELHKAMIQDLEKGLESSLNLNKAQLQRQIKELSDEEIKPLLDRIQKYLECGGLFNPECMEHDKVRDLIMACKAILKKASEK